MNISTIEQGEELLRKCEETKRYDMEVIEPAKKYPIIGVDIADECADHSAIVRGLRRKDGTLSVTSVEHISEPIFHNDVSAYVYQEIQRRSEFIDIFFIETVPPLHLKILKRLPILKHLFGYTVAFHEDDRDRISILRHGKMLATKRYKRA